MDFVQNRLQTEAKNRQEGRLEGRSKIYLIMRKEDRMTLLGLGWSFRTRTMNVVMMRLKDQPATLNRVRQMKVFGIVI